ncbi:MAG: Protease HtpX-like protein [Candidatus Nomurabacteria bacterium GW2011_GWF2_35_66]|uniref:Protease HtpX homolog n=1 Tax=Candidatus Nomurabacteria bacterium GW2011_GWE1_35_16 TaxID=1618761 RepID=A0A0G0EHH6_9BACT|nr:MAG: Protease HtpX-like protein [Candidatus Nomurabacteria bacterium GW2011_GWF1_34_20]KKP63525.1 MAG: Protease HtpX-like protein [Candidatus Nomurabacteria bacterium GW2011_GWE2_34_25]KKP66717.1 MAG: Protease HtpX-like protein [Candidatus Nomurabacteria bacterium GW2011_GWE1_35_16]KKP83817.1 MAG: Protease HtpX-like protein [Candidatus Nomurabacteria bacterium GW2011_GWF2_35_66]HAE36393.1 zinc metalloprotease HtpX [Candidatus Nomurabacteria bacterium]
MATLYTHQGENVTKTWILMSMFLIIVIGLGYIFARVYGNPNILYIFVVFSLIMNITSYWFSDKIALSLAKAHPATREQYFDFYTIVENLAITAGLPMPKIYVIEDPSPNAFATGRDKNHAVVAVTTGLLSIMNKSELEGVVAHEMSHIGNKDMLVSTVAVVLVGFVAIVSDMMMRMSIFGGHRDNDRGSGLLMIIGIVVAILAPIAATLIQLGISRKREYLADASGALLTRYPEGLASALEKISQYGRPMQSQSGAIAHLYIANPLGSGNFKKKTMNLFSTHPPVEERIKRLRGSL